MAAAVTPTSLEGVTRVCVSLPLVRAEQNSGRQSSVHHMGMTRLWKAAERVWDSHPLNLPKPNESDKWEGMFLLGIYVMETNGLRLVPPLDNLLLLRHVYSAFLVTIMLSSITYMVYGGGYEACQRDLYDPAGEQDLDGFDGFDC